MARRKGSTGETAQQEVLRGSVTKRSKVSGEGRRRTRMRGDDLFKEKGDGTNGSMRGAPCESGVNDVSAKKDSGST